MNSGSDAVYRITSNNSGEWTTQTFYKEAQTTYTKGETQYENVTSDNKEEYPTNDKSGDYWYVYIEK